jgi:hypothetical protein
VPVFITGLGLIAAAIAGVFWLLSRCAGRPGTQEEAKAAVS